MYVFTNGLQPSCDVLSAAISILNLVECDLGSYIDRDTNITVELDKVGL